MHSAASFAFVFAIRSLRSCGHPICLPLSRELRRRMSSTAVSSGRLDTFVERVTKYWFSGLESGKAVPGKLPGLWFGGGDSVDADVSARFSADIGAIVKGEYDSLKGDPEGVLCLVVVLDQFTRNVHRNKPESFHFDALARELAKHSLDAGLYDKLDRIKRTFLILPFEHAEDMDEQKRCMKLARSNIDGACEAYVDSYLKGFVDFAQKHYDVIERFGRFPHRNKILKRESTAEERQFLIDHNGFM